MKKVIICFVLVLSNYLLVSSQVIKVENGLSVSSMNSSKFDLMNGSFYSYSVLLGCDYWEHPYFYLSSSIGYIKKGGKDNVLLLDSYSQPLQNVTVKGKWDYLHLNTSFRIKYPIQHSHLYLGAGLKADILTSSPYFNNMLDVEKGYKMESFIPGMKLETGFNKEIRKLVIGLNASYLIDFNRIGKSILLQNGTYNYISNSNTLLFLTLGYKL